MIIVRHGSDRREERFAKPRIKIGSSPSSDLRLDAPGIAPEHAEVYVEDGWLLIRDSGSSGGTFVNGARLAAAPWPISTGDRVRLGASGPELGLSAEGATRETALRALWGSTIGSAKTSDAEITLRSKELDFRVAKTVEATLATLSGAATNPRDAATVIPPGPGAETNAAAEATVAPPGPGVEPKALAVSPPSYELLSELGRGGMGVVYRARQPGLAREVAIKKILPDQDKEETRARFVSEALTTGFLDHPNVVPVHELKADKGEVLLSMKLVGGVSWKDLLHPRKPEHELLAKKHDMDSHLSILLAACNAVAFAHSKDIVHRDLKPENVMVGEFGEVLVMDWGIAVSCGDERDTRAPHRSTVLAPSGTPAYMAPEMAEGEGEKIGPATDVFLLGAILHEILTGRPPHSGGNIFAVLLAASRAEPPVFGPGVPKELGAICAKALAREPGSRYGSVVEFQDSIRGYLKHRESTKISDAAMATLARCEDGGQGVGREQAYASYSEAVAGFRQALVLWGENDSARGGEKRARVAYANAALGHGDLGLAETLVAGLAADDPDRGRIVGAAMAARDEIAARNRRARWTRRGLFASLAAILVGGGVSYFLVRAERDEQKRQRERADQNADAERLEALRAKAALDEVDLREMWNLKDREGTRDWKRVLTEAARVASESRALARSADALALRSPDATPIRSRLEDLADSAGVAARDVLLDRCAESVLGCASPPRGPSFSPDGGSIAAGYGRLVVVWSVETGEVAQTFAGHTDVISACAFAPDGREVLSGSRDRTLRLWDRASGRLVQVFQGHTGPVTACAFAPDGREILSASEDRTLRLWDRASGRLVRTFEGHTKRVLACAFAPDGREVLSASEDTTLGLWDRASGRLVRTFEGHGTSVTACVFAPDGREVLSASRDLTLRLWDRASGRLVRTFGHDDAVAACAFAPDGREVLSASDDRTLRLWDRESGRLVRTFEGHGNPVNACAFSPDGRRVLSASEDSTLRLWDRESGRLVRALEGHTGAVRACAFAPDGREALSASLDGTLRLWDRRSGRLVRTFEGHTDVVEACAFAPDGREILSGAQDRTLRLWDRATGRLVRTFEGHAGGVTACAFAPDGREVLSASEDKTLRLWDRASGRLVRTFEGHTGQVRAGAFAPDGREVLSASRDKTLRLWDRASGRLIRTFEGHTEEVRACAFAPSGREILSASRDKTLRLWDRSSGRLIRTFEGDTGEVLACAFAPGGREVLSGSQDRTLRLWDCSSGRLVQTFEGHDAYVAACAFAPDGRDVLAASSVTLELWDRAIGHLVRRIQDRTGVLSCALAPDGREVLSAAFDKTLRLWDRSSGRLVRTFEGPGAGVLTPRLAPFPFPCAFAPDGREVLSAAEEKTLRLWDRAGGRLVRAFEGHTGNVLACAFSSDGREVLSGSRDKTLRLWDRASGRLVRTFEGHTDGVSACAFSPDGREVLSASEDKTLRLWDRASGRLVRTLEGHTGDVSACAFSPDGREVLSASFDKTLKLWDRSSGSLVRTFEGHTGGVEACAFAPDGRGVLSSSSDGTLRLWDRASGRLVRTFEGHTDEVGGCAFATDGREVEVLSASLDGTLRLWSAGSGDVEELARGFDEDPVGVVRRVEALDSAACLRSLSRLPRLVPADTATCDTAALATRGLTLMLSDPDPTPGARAGRIYLGTAAPWIPRAATRLAWALDRGLGGPRDSEAAKRLRGDAAAQGDALALGHTAEAAKAGDLLAEVLDAIAAKDVARIRAAAERNEPDAMIALARLVPDEAERWLERGAALGDPPCLRLLGVRRLAEGRLDARPILGDAAREGDPEALRILKAAASTGDPEATNILEALPSTNGR